MQNYPTSCSPASLAMVLTYYLGLPTTDAEMINFSKSQGQGAGSEDLEKLCSKIGYWAMPLPTLTLPQLPHQFDSSNVPAMVLWTQPEGHWIVVVGRYGSDLLVSDPNQGNI